MPIVHVTRPVDGVAVVTLADERRYNALSSTLIAELHGALTELRADRTVRAVVLTGAGRGFCAGANLAGDDEMPPAARIAARSAGSTTSRRRLAELILAIHELPQPVIAAVHGAAVGGGLAVALACDLRIASADAYFASHFIRVGLSSCDVGTSFFLPRLILADQGRRADAHRPPVRAAEADRLGLLNQVVDAPEALLPAALELAAAITANSEYGVLLTKVGFWTNLDSPSLRHTIQLENRTQVLGTFTGNMGEAGPTPSATSAHRSGERCKSLTLRAARRRPWPPGGGSIQIRPPCASTRPRAIARPSPAPPVARLRLGVGPGEPVEGVAGELGREPRAASTTRTDGRPVRRRTTHLDGRPAGAWRIALSSRLRMTRPIAAGVAVDRARRPATAGRA